MHILHGQELQGRKNYTLDSENRRVVLSLNTDENVADDTPDAHTLRFWALSASNDMTTIPYKKSDEKEAIQAFREILGAAKGSLANLSDFELTEPKTKPKPPTKPPAKEVPKTEAQTG